MSTGKLIKDAPLGRVIGKMKIPVTGNFAITPDQLRGFINSSSSIYETTDPTILPSNGLVQDLKLGASGKLTFDSLDGQEVFLRVSGNYPLDLSGFYNVLDYTRDPTKRTFILIINWLGLPLMFAYDYENGDDEPVDPIHCEGAGSSVTYSFIKPIGTEPSDFILAVIIDGVIIPEDQDYPEYLTVTNVPNPSEIPDGYDFAQPQSYTIVNKDNQPHKIELRYTSNTTGIMVNGNSSIVDLGTKPYSDFGFCLNPSGVPMGCEGATQDFSLSHIEGVYDFYINGTLLVTAPVGVISGWLDSNGYSNRLVIDFDGTMNAQNMTQDEYFLLDFVGVNGEQPWSFTDPSNNPSYVEHPDLGFTVCLAPKGELSCEGATMGIAVQMSLSPTTITTFTVNGRSEVFMNPVGVNISEWFNNLFGDTITMTRGDYTIFESMNTECNSVIVDNTTFETQVPYPVDNGFGENTTFKVDGQYMSFLLGGDQITCEGATPYAVTGEMYLDSDTVVTINGDQVSQDSNALIGAVTYGEALMIVNSPDGSYTLINATENDIRVSIDGTAQWNSGDAGWSDNPNPTMQVDFSGGSLKLCISASEPKFSGIWDDTKIPEVNKDQLRLLLQNGATTAQITQPNGVTISKYFTVARQDIAFPRMNGFYYITAPFDNTVMDVIYLCADNTVAPERPVIQSAIRSGGSVRFIGTAPPNVVIRVFGDFDPQSFDIPYAFGISSASGAFDFTVTVPTAITSGYLRSQQGNWSSQQTDFIIT